MAIFNSYVKLPEGSHSCSCEDDHQSTPEIPWIQKKPPFSQSQSGEIIGPPKRSPKKRPKRIQPVTQPDMHFFWGEFEFLPSWSGTKTPNHQSSNDPDHSWSQGDGANSPMMRFTTFVLGPDQVWVRKAGFFNYVVEWGWPIHYVPWLKLESIAMNCPYWAMVIRFDWVNRQLRFVGPSYTNSCTSARLY